MVHLWTRTMNPPGRRRSRSVRPDPSGPSRNSADQRAAVRYETGIIRISPHQIAHAAVAAASPPLGNGPDGGGGGFTARGRGAVQEPDGKNTAGVPAARASGRKRWIVLTAAVIVRTGPPRPPDVSATARPGLNNISFLRSAGLQVWKPFSRDVKGNKGSEAGNLQTAREPAKSSFYYRV